MTLRGHFPRATQPPDLSEYKQLRYNPDRVDPRGVNVSPLVQPRESAGRRQFRDCATCDRRRLCRPDAFAYPDCEQPLDDGRKPGDADALQRAIVRLLADGALKHDEIRRLIGCGQQRVLPALHTLMDAGQVRCARRGGAKYYSLTEKGHADAN